MHDELNRPLGLDRHKAKPSGRRLAFAILAGCCFLIGAGAFFFAERFMPADPFNGDQLASADNASTNGTAKVSGETTGSTRSGNDGSTGGPALVPIEPDGMIEPKPVLPEIHRQELALAHMPDPALLENGAAGSLPRRAEDGARPMDVYSRPPATEGNFGVARVVLIVGGMGISQTGSQQAVHNLPGAVTLAFAPYGNSLGRWMQEARKQGHEILLQVPMEPFDYPANDPGPHTLLAEADSTQNLADLHWAMSRLTNYVGVMNFLGGKMVTNPDVLKPVFDDLARRGLLFVDDGTVKNSRTEEVAQLAVLPYARAQIAIDADRSRAAIAAKLNELVKEARRTGLAIGVANAFPDSIDMIAQFAARAEELGIEITPVSAIVDDPERERG